MISGKTIFISALDWGTGHTTRCVPVIRQLEKNNRIIIGITPLTKTIFKQEFPDHIKLNVPAYDIKYSSILPVSLKLFFDWRRISGIIAAENKFLDRIIDEHKIDVVISDNRFGLYSKKIHSIFITHQLFLKTPFANSIAQKKNKKYILNFNEVWVPDFEERSKSLAGELSHGTHFHPNIKYIGPQSRLQKTNVSQNQYDFVFLLSGPEPHRTVFMDLLLKKAKQYPELKFAFVIPDTRKHETTNADTFISPTSETLSEIISSCKKIICRSGYSSLMDLHLAEKKEIILVPTPGQTEQEYLAEYWKKNFGASVIAQKNINQLQL